MNKWQLARKNPAYLKLTDDLKITRLAARILSNRGLNDIDMVKKFLNPDLDETNDPFILPDMEKAVARIIQEKGTGKPVGIFGDYDVDGLVSITILKMFLSNIGIESLFYIPNRFNEGYGLSREGIDYFVKNNVSLLITVDCGATAHREVDYAKSRNMDVIVTDHHELDDCLPPALAVIDPKRKDSKYSFRELAGVGVVYKLIQGIARNMELGLNDDEFLEFVAVGTIADIVPIIDENRIFVKYGLNRLNKLENVGLKTLISSTGLLHKKLDTMQISFILAPRINACGRLGHAYPVLDLFFTRNEEEAMLVAEKLNLDNQKRKEIENYILAEAIEQIKKMKTPSKGLIVSQENWHRGVIGLVASKLVEMYRKPAIVISIENDIAYGSGRSYGNFNIYSALKECFPHLISYGGHKYAVGLSLKTNTIENFKKSFLSILNKELVVDQEEENIIIDEEISFNQISQNLLLFLSQLSPFGVGNPKPIFLTRGVEVVAPVSINSRHHMQIRMRESNTLVNATCYKLKNKIDIIPNKYYDILYNIDFQEKKGKFNYQLNLIEVHQNLELRPDDIWE
ncbi:MAG: single-stranded-DNA-specific exonuclease RecJ [Candidatus Coatesbacteria bacterium]|nr:single-stranded-DNA-specific exonuclease RecJ [Candidatus Coatesbacteria bacterium]